MIHSIADQPWIFLAFVIILALLIFGATIRVRRDRILKRRANIERRKRQRQASGKK